MKLLLGLVLLSLVTIGAAFHADAQIRAVTKDGQHVVLFPDGTWKFDTEVDSTQIRDGSITINPPSIIGSDSALAVVIVPKPKPRPPRVYSLDCPDLVDVERDVTSDANLKISRRLNILKEDSTLSFSISLTKTKKSSLWWKTTIPGNVCINPNCRMILVMDDGKSYTLDTDSKANCKGEFQLNFGGLDGKDDMLATLKQYVIKSLRIYTVKGFVEGDFDEENGKKWRAAINCIYSK